MAWAILARIGLATGLAVVSGLSLPCPASAQSAWTLDPAQSVLTYQSVKKNTIVETNTIRNVSGGIESDGSATVMFDLNSVDTGVDLRNVRMRFLFFETFQYPTATVSAKVDPAIMAELKQKRRLVMPLTFSLDLHGVKKELTANVAVTSVSDDLVSVSSQAPITVKVEDFGLLPAIEKLQRAANVENIVPVASVSFDFVFSSNPAAAGNVKPVAAAASTGPIVTDQTRTEYSPEECGNRFDVLSRTGAIYFRSGSARLDPASRPLLANVVDVVTKCPAMRVEVAGYTDSDGSDSDNRSLSERRASAVRDYLLKTGIADGRISAVGYGEERPVAANDTAKNKALNRRIEFHPSAAAN